MLRYSLRTLLLVMLLGGPGLAAGWYLWKRWQKPEPLMLEEVEPGGIDFPPDPSVWLQEPARTGRPTINDELAFNQLLKSIEANQDVEFRQQYTVQIPREPTGLPQDYDLLLYGQYVGRSLQRCEVNVRGKRATIENVTVAGIRRGEVGREEIDRLARELVYAHRCTHAAKQDAEPFAILGGIHATHTPDQTIELISRTKGVPFHLKTMPKQHLADSVSLSTRAVPGLVETQLSRRLDEIAEKQLTPVTPNEAEKKKVLVRLEGLGQPHGGEASYAMREDLSAIEALLYSHHAVRWRIVAALPELQRLRLTEAETQLRMVIYDDRSPLSEKATRHELAR